MVDSVYSSKMFYVGALFILLLIFIYPHQVHAQQLQLKIDTINDDRRFTQDQAFQYAKQLLAEPDSDSIAYTLIEPIIMNNESECWCCSFYDEIPEMGGYWLELKHAIIFNDKTGEILYHWDNYSQIMSDFEKEKGSFLTWTVEEQALYDHLFALMISANSKHHWFQISLPEKTDLDSAEAIETVKQFMINTLKITNISEDALWLSSHVTEYDTSTWERSRHLWYIYCCELICEQSLDEKYVIYSDNIPYAIKYNAIIDCQDNNVFDVLLYKYIDGTDRLVESLYPSLQ